MGHMCAKCGIDSLFFQWSTDRRFPKHLFPNQLDKNGKMRESFVVCLWCLNEIKNK